MYKNPDKKSWNPGIKIPKLRKNPEFWWLKSRNHGKKFQFSKTSQFRIMKVAFKSLILRLTEFQLARFVFWKMRATFSLGKNPRSSGFFGIFQRLHMIFKLSPPKWLRDRKSSKRVKAWELGLAFRFWVDPGAHRWVRIN